MKAKAVVRKGKPQPKPKQPDFEIDQELRREMEAEAGAGLENVTIADRAFWLPDIDDPDSEPWYRAFEDIDTRGDWTALIAELRAGKPPPPAVCIHLADLLERYNHRHKPGKRRTPSYDRTGKDPDLGARGSSAKRDLPETVVACLGDRNENGVLTNLRMAFHKIRDGDPRQLHGRSCARRRRARA